MPRMYSINKGTWSKGCTKCEHTFTVLANTFEEAANLMGKHFRSSHYNQWNCRTVDGMRSSCRSCDQNQTAGRDNSVHRDEMLEAQEGKCKICETTITFSIRNGACVDHDHKTNRLRAILCNKCNVAMAAIDNDDWLEKAIIYRDSY